MLMIALHLVLGFFLIVPFLVFGFVHLATSWKRPNRTAVRFGLALLGVAIVILSRGWSWCGWEASRSATRESATSATGCTS